MIEDFIIEQFDELECTQDYAKQQLGSGKIKTNTVISTLFQTKGRGRGDKEWVGTPDNIAITLVLKPDVDPELFSQVSYVAALAVGQTIAFYNPALDLKYKWVNDVFVGSEKISGILLEKVGDYLLVGIGINLKPNEEMFKVKGTSLEDCEIRISHDEFLDRLLDKFKKVYNMWFEVGFIPIKNQWLHKAKGMDQKIEVNLPDSKVEGIFISIDDDGKLLLLTDQKVKTIEAGDLFFSTA